MPQVAYIAVAIGCIDSPVVRNTKLKLGKTKEIFKYLQAELQKKVCKTAQCKGPPRAFEEPGANGKMKPRQL